MDLDSKRLYLASKKEKGIRRRVFKSFMKRRIRRFDVVKWTSTKWAKKKRDARVGGGGREVPKISMTHIVSPPSSVSKLFL